MLHHLRPHGASDGPLPPGADPHQPLAGSGDGASHGAVVGVRSLAVGTYHSTDDLVWFAVERAVQSGLVEPGQIVLVLAGAPDRPSGASTDVLRIVRVA